MSSALTVVCKGEADVLHSVKRKFIPFVEKLYWEGTAWILTRFDG